jgi:hypothetical protein
LSGVRDKGIVARIRRLVLDMAIRQTSP